MLKKKYDVPEYTFVIAYSKLLITSLFFRFSTRIYGHRYPDESLDNGNTDE